MADDNLKGCASRVCPICGRTFIPTYKWVYKKYINGDYVYYCRYNCFQKSPKPKRKYINRVVN